MERQLDPFVVLAYNFLKLNGTSSNERAIGLLAPGESKIPFTRFSTLNYVTVIQTGQSPPSRAAAEFLGEDVD